MIPQPFPLVADQDGVKGQLESSPVDTASPQDAVVRLESGQRITVPASLLVSQADGSFLLPLSFAGLDAAATSPTETLVIPIVAEEITVTKRMQETGMVRIRKTVREHDELVDDPLLRERVTVETVSINKVVEGPIPTVCQIGDTTIIPIFEEVLVVTKQLILKEELHIHREQQTYHDPQTVTLRTEEVQVERVDPGQEKDS